MPRLIVVEEYLATYTDPISFSKGERVEVQREDSEYPNWYWCQNTSGKEGWVHASFLAATSGLTVGSRDYNALELSVRTGQEVTVVEQLDGWLYVSLEAGHQGWIQEAFVGSGTA